MMHLYHLLDFLVTVTETLSLCVLISCFLKKPRFHRGISLITPAVISFLVAFIATRFSDIGAVKIFLVMGFAFFTIVCCYRDSVVSIIVTIEIWFISLIILPERVIFVLASWLWKGDILIVVNGTEVIKWGVYILNILIRLLVIICVYGLLKNFQYKIQIGDLIALTFDFLIVLIMFFISLYSFLNLDTIVLHTLDVVTMTFSFVFMVHFLYSKNIFHLREQEQKNKMQIAQLHQQYSYYRDKFREEERIRSIYHDMKNHLLVLEGSQTSVGTNQMVEKLRSQIADYENYIHTGNEFLDIIVREKATVAKEKGIDFNVLVHFEDGLFLDALDISVIFGNALDNAIEASEKLPQAQRLITVKAERRQDMLVIIVSNNTLSDTPVPKQTSKTDSYLHGFGLSNIRNAVEKYGGQCSINIENGIFTLKLILPIL